MANISEPYMLKRDLKESQRLDTQHVFMRALSNDHLIHPSIPCETFKTIADVGTGTGVWLQDVAQSLLASDSVSKDTEFVGFDVSAQQFPPKENTGISFVVQNIAKPFPPQYRDKFDLVHVRLLSYAIKAEDLEMAVENVVQILRPGGFLQWQECDAIDSWATPETATTRSMVHYVVSERIARGLTPAISTPLIRTIQSLCIAPAVGKVNQINWSHEIMRVTHLETVSTTGHSSTTVLNEKSTIVISAALQLIHAGISRRQAKAADPQTSASEMEQLTKDVGAMMKLTEAITKGEVEAQSNWDLAMTWIVARKAVYMGQQDAWMSNRYTL